MSIEDEVRRQRRQGETIRAIAKRLGLSRMKVQRIIDAAPALGADDDDEDDGMMAMLAALDSDTAAFPNDNCGCELTPPLRYLGDDAAGEWRVIDALGRPVNSLRRYRYQFHDHTDEGGPAEAEREAVIADLERQAEAAGLSS